MEDGSVGTPTKEALREYFATHEDVKVKMSWLCIEIQRQDIYLLSGWMI